MYTQTCNITKNITTKLDYYDNMFKLESNATLISYFKSDDGRHTLILDSTLFHPQGGGQPSDTGIVTDSPSPTVMSTLLYKMFDHKAELEFEKELEKGKKVFLHVDESRRKLNSRLHSAGHLMDAGMQNVGLRHLEPGNGYFFSDGYLFTGPYVEYKGTAPQSKLQSKSKELELEANAMISRGGKLSVAVLPYEEASKLCDGVLPDYIPKGSTPRIVKLGNNPGCPCGGTHVSDISEIISMKA